MEETKEITKPETTSTDVAPVKRQLPTLEELNYDPEQAFAKDQFNLLVNQPPKKNWIVQHPTVKKEITLPNGAKTKVPSEYIPIDKVEFLLTRIFQDWSVEVLREGQLFNSVYCTVRLHMIHPVTGKAIFYDGVGAVGIQTDAGKQASDLTAIKQAAIMMALPAAKSYAIKDAAEHIGKVFGKDLNRKDAIEFSMTYGKEVKTNLENMESKMEDMETSSIRKELIEAVMKAKTKKEANDVYKNNKDDQSEELKELIKKRYADIDLEKMQANAAASEAAGQEGK